MTSEQLNQRFIYVPKFYIYLSLGIHACIPFFLMMLGVLDNYDIGPFGKRNRILREVYQEFIQVDVVALPTTLMKDLPKVDSSLDVVDKIKEMEKAQPLQQPEEDILPDPSVSAKETQKLAEEKKKEELEEQKKKDRIEREKILKDLENETRRSEALKALEKEKKGRHALKGNILSKGTSTRGNIGSARKAYESFITQKIKQHFNIYPWQRKKDLISVVFIKINPAGKVTEKRVLRPSLDPLFDSAVLQAVDSAQPLPVPEELSIIEDGISVEFRPDD